jgi:5-methylcytosine-specific restriction enzyme B
MPLSLQDCTELLKNNKNLILTGAPGTGKTYLAKEIAKKLIGRDDIENSNQYKFVQFHPSYDYTDFVEGLRPTPPNANNQIGFKRENGVFKQFCENAISNSSDNSQQNNQTNPQTPPPNNTEQTKKIEEDIKTALDKFLKENITDKKDNNKAFKTKQGKQFHISSYKNNIISIHKDEGQAKKTLTIQMKAVLDFLIHIYKEDEKLYLDINLKKQGEWPLQREIKRNDPINGIVSKDNEVRYHVWGICKRFFEEYFNKVGDIKLEDTPQTDNERKDNFVFVIDEINRGEISKIFGELFFSIDPGYRGKEGIVQTQYQNMIDDETDPFKDGFYVPENVYIIGTMNDIDRSVESMDFAMRRRFAWQEIQAEDTQEMLSELGENKDTAIKRMNNLNAKIISDEIGLTPAYQIGASYFLKLKNYGNDFEKLWNYHIKGLLFEYLRGQEDADNKLKALHSAYELINQQENNEPNNNN